MKNTDRYVPAYKYIGIEILILFISYLIVRFPLFRLHGSFDAPLLAMIPAVFGLMATMIIRWPYSFMGTAFGYLISFVTAQIFKKEYIDPGHGNTLHNNWFEIWIITYSIIIVICIIMDMISAGRQKRGYIK